jgi:hypothetical protein
MMAVDHSRAVMDYHNQHNPTSFFSHRGLNKCGQEAVASTEAKAAKAVRRPKTKKRVRFASSVKTHDGLSPHNHVFDEVVHDLFNRPDNRYRTIRGVLNTCNVVVLDRLKEMILELMNRCAKGKSPVLNCGGGRNNVVDERFAPWLFKLANKITSQVDTIVHCSRTKPEGLSQLRLGDTFRI